MNQPRSDKIYEYVFHFVSLEMKKRQPEPVVNVPDLFKSTGLSAAPLQM